MLAEKGLSQSPSGSVPFLPEAGEHRLEQWEVHAVRDVASHRGEEHLAAALAFAQFLAVLWLEVVVEAAEIMSGSTSKCLARAGMSIGTMTFVARVAPS